jgi:glycosyltransferase involved in cell wall biosynthesis
MGIPGLAWMCGLHSQYRRSPAAILVVMVQRDGSAGNVSVYIQSQPWFIRPRNTDWRYTRFSIPRIGELESSCHFYAARSQRIALECNWRYVRQLLARRLHLPAPAAHGSLLDRGEFARSDCQVVFCHDDFPRNAEGIPVVWQNSILDPEMERARGQSDEQLAAQRAEKEPGFRRARFVQVSTEAERIRLGKWFPQLAEKFVAIPFFLPDVHPLDEAQFEQKLAGTGPLRCVFVGHEARRKGLARVYDAFSALPSAMRERIHLTVVSRQSDGRVAAPPLPNITVHSELPFAETQQLIRRSDVFLMPSFYESFGLVFVEAMAQGTIPIAPNWEVQREIVDDGRAGILASGEPSELAEWLVRLSDDCTLRASLARNAWQRFHSCFAPQIVARTYCDLFHRAARL